MMTEEEHGQLKALAWRTLKAVDHIDAKAEDEGKTISPDWRAWRTQVRAVIRGDLMEIPEEPPRYVSSVAPTNPSAIFNASWGSLASPPAEVLAEAKPDEDLGELKHRLLVELGSLRNMLVGNIPMMPDEQSRKLERLAALEHPTILNWLQG